MIAAWVWFPLVALAICLGCGLLVERLAGVRLPGAILPSLGLALAIVAATLTTYKGATAKLTTPLVIALAVVGYASSIGRVRALRPDGFALAVGVSLFAVFAAPIVLSGNATWAGYYVLNDSAVHFTLIDQLLAHGRDLSSSHASTLAPILHSYLSSAYPIGAQAALGAVRPLTGQNVAWIFQPYLALILSLGGVTIYQLLDGVVSSRGLRALCAFVAAQAGLVYAYYLEASIKELATTWIITLVVVLVIEALKQRLTVRRIVPLAIVVVAAFDVLGAAIVPWLGVPLAVFAALALWRMRHAISAMPKRRLALVSGACVVGLAAVALPIIATAQTSFNVLSAALTKRGDLGNILHPLSKWQMLGIWPSGDFRIRVGDYAHQIPHGELITTLLIALAVASAVLAIVWLVLRRAFGPLLLLIGSGIAAFYLLTRASPYAGAKVLMICSLAIALTVMLGAPAAADLGRRLLGSRRAAELAAWTLAVLLAGGVLWTNIDAYAGVRLAPRSQYSELEAIGARFSGQGPVFYDLGDEYALHFLRAELPTVPVFQPPPLQPGVPQRAVKQRSYPWYLSELDQSYVQGFPLLVLGRSPVGPRPPANYLLVFEGRYYQVWRRANTPTVLAHVSLGRPSLPVAVADCASVVRLAGRASAAGARLAYATRALPVVIPPSQLRFATASAAGPESAAPSEASEETAVFLRHAGVIHGQMQIPRAGRYEVWVDLSVSRQVRVRIDGRFVGWASYEVGPPQQYLFIGKVNLTAGAHQLTIVVPSESLMPGQFSRRQSVTSVVLTPASGPEAVTQVQPSRARSLCGRPLDWIEIVR
jgi:hypothetical protein